MRIYLIYISLLLSLPSFAQKQTYNWYFGSGMGLDFHTIPPTALSNSNIMCLEGSSVLSDASGRLLCYSNGVVVMNRNHLPMMNGNEILGNLSSTSNSIFIRLPESEDIYYLFTVGAASESGEGLRFSIIDMRLDNGLGAVTSKNNLVNDNCYEKLAAVRHCNNRDTWIVTHEWESNKYLAYLLTASGLSAPVESSGSVFTGGYANNALGVLKFSGDGTQAASAHSFGNDAVELMNFNRTTGLLSAPVVFQPNNPTVSGGFTGVYGVEFSPDGKKLYVSSSNSDPLPGILYQFDISARNVNLINNSKFEISREAIYTGGGLQAGPDGKIYYARQGSSALAVINFPDLPGVGCGYQANAIAVERPRSIQYNLPGFIAGDVDPRYVAYDFSAVPAASCGDTHVDFAVNRIDGIDSVKWDFGDGGTSSSLQVNHAFAGIGDYHVVLTIFSQDCNSNSHVIRHVIKVGSELPQNFLPRDSTACTFESFYIHAPAVTGASFTWQDGSTLDSMLIDKAGTYWLDLSLNGCSSRDSFNFYNNAGIRPSLGNDTTVCLDKPVILNAGYSWTGYSWNTGESTPSIEVSHPGNYELVVTDLNGCLYRDTVEVTWGDCAIYLPNVFTPNRDGKNERFRLLSGVNGAFELLIYNRYGQLMKRITNATDSWDGKFQRDIQPTGIYPWIFKYADKAGHSRVIKGTVLLIR